MEWWWAVRLVIPPVLVIVVFSAVIAARQRTLRRIAVVWNWLGPPQRVYGAGRQWSGAVDGRALTVTWFERTLTMKLAARPTARLGFGPTGQPPSAVEAARDGAEGKPLGTFTGYGRGADTVAKRVPEALHTLLDTGGPQAVRAINVDPEQGVSWLARPIPAREQSPAQAHAWANALADVARETERL